MNKIFIILDLQTMEIVRDENGRIKYYNKEEAKKEVQTYQQATIVNTVIQYSISSPLVLE